MFVRKAPRQVAEPSATTRAASSVACCIAAFKLDHYGGEIAAQFKVGKATDHSVIKDAKTATQAPAPTTPTKAAKAARKPAAPSAGDETDMARRAILEPQHGQLRPHP